MRYYWPWVVLALIVLGCGGLGTLFVRWATRDPLGAYRAYHGHREEVFAVDFDDTGTLVASGAQDGLRIWRVSNLETIHRQGGRIMAVQFLAGSSQLAYGDTGQGIVVCSVPDGAVQHVYGQPSPWMVMAASPDGRWIAGAYPNTDRCSPNYRPEYAFVYVWDTSNGDRQTILEGHEGPIIGLAIHPTEPILASYAADETLRIWDMNNGQQIGQRGSPRLQNQISSASTGDALEFSDSGNELLVGTTLLSTSELNCFQWTPNISQHYVRCSTLSPDEQLLIVGGRGFVGIFDKHHKKRIASFPVLRNGTTVNSVSVSKDGKFLVTGGDGLLGLFGAIAAKLPTKDTTIRIWKMDEQIQRGNVVD
jgi:WD40 repeat protein